jgi:hypothetical protein
VFLVLLKADHNPARPDWNALGVPFPDLDAIPLDAWQNFVKSNTGSLFQGPDFPARDVAAFD